MSKKHFFRLILLTTFTWFLTFLPLSSVIAADLSAPQMAIENASNQLKVKLQEEGFRKDFKKITEFVNDVIYPNVDFDRIAALVLGKHWKTASDDEKQRFKTEFQTLLVRTYSRAFLEFKDWSIRYLPISADPEDGQKVIVKTEVLQPGLQPIAVNYRMLETNGVWKAYDIMIEGVSLVTNYRTSFKNEIDRNGSLTSVIESLSIRNKEALASKEPS